MNTKNLFRLAILMIAVLPINMMSQDTKTYNIGKFEISTLPESQGNGNTKILIGTTPKMIEEYLPDETFPNATNAFLVKTPEHTILVDAGFGRQLFDNLKALNVTPEQIDIILLTHMHGDHIGGLLKDEKVTFPNATLYLGQIEHDYWAKGDHASQQKVINAYKDKLKLFTNNEITNIKTSLLPGIYGIAAYGHTPGHTAFMLESENQQFLVWGDLTHAMKIQMPCPQVAVTYDVDPELAIKSRKEILEYVSKNNIPIAGMHIAFPGMGTIISNQTGGYEFTPIANQ
ncbi:MAG: MBL fold metallo-hydrolase [Tannerella sp.]|jgi:glyoxylase-like metal-dependent hydrolase (beta-lactamase superfamily II)|nr:MBL fold metallo-hydrolase [Tannerella sp.]